MKQPTRILAIFDRSDTDYRLLVKVSRLARKLKASLELFLCDAEGAYALKHGYEARHSDEARRASITQANDYLARLMHSADAHDVRMSIDAACESPLYESIVRKVLQSRPDLVIKSASGIDSPEAFDPNDWQLMRKCPATLMMTRGRIWSAQPRFAAALDVSTEETAVLAGSILETAQDLRGGDGTDLDVIYSERGGVGRDTTEARAVALRILARQSHVDGNRVHILDGDPERTLPNFARQHDYDVLVLGALTDRRGDVQLVGTLTEKLMEAIDCDFVLVKPGVSQPVRDSLMADESRPLGDATPYAVPTLPSAEVLTGTRLFRGRTHSIGTDHDVRKSPIGVI